MWLSKDGLLQTEMQSNSFPFFSKNHENKLAPNTELLTTVTDKLKRELKLQNFHRSLLEVISSAELQWNAKILFLRQHLPSSTNHWIIGHIEAEKITTNFKISFSFIGSTPCRKKMMTHGKMHLTIQENVILC